MNEDLSLLINTSYQKLQSAIILFTGYVLTKNNTQM